MWWRELDEVENECTSHNFSLLVIILPKIIKIAGNLTKFRQKQFFETLCSRVLRSVRHSGSVKGRHAWVTIVSGCIASPALLLLRHVNRPLPLVIVQPTAPSLCLSDLDISTIVSSRVKATHRCQLGNASRLPKTRVTRPFSNPVSYTHLTLPTNREV